MRSDHSGFPLWEEGWEWWTVTFPPLYSSCDHFEGRALLLYLLCLLCFQFLWDGKNWWISESKEIVVIYLLLLWSKRGRGLHCNIMAHTAWNSNKNPSEDWDLNFDWNFRLWVFAFLKFMRGGDRYTKKWKWTESVWGFP